MKMLVIIGYAKGVHLPYMSRLKRHFFEQSTLIVAKELLGKVLIFNNYQGLITETEAYIGEDDPACHAAKGRTNRTEIMYGKAGYSYVYLIYGMYYCLNIVTEAQDFPAAVNINIINNLIAHPTALDSTSFNNLFEFGGFPEPLIKQEMRFYHRWQNLRQEQSLREDIRSLSQIQDISQIELLTVQLQHQAGQLINYNNLAKKIRVSDHTISRWIALLESLYYCFKIPPFSTNIARSLLKEPKLYFWDWSLVKDHGAKIENFVACHLLKAIDFWNNLGFGKFGLYFIRDKEQREVDFLVTKNLQPWLLIEVKKSATDALNKNLFLFKSQLNPQFTFQLAFDLPYIDYDFRDLTEPKIIPLKTFLSQLI